MSWSEFIDLDIREVEILHKGAKMMLIERDMKDIYHLRLANADDKDYLDAIRKLQWKHEALRNIKPVNLTPDQAAKNRKDLATTLGLKPKKR